MRYPEAVDITHYVFPKKVGGIYLLYCKERLIYVGQSHNVYQRAITHSNSRAFEFDRVEYIPIEDEVERSALEMFIIWKHCPCKNNKRPGIPTCASDDLALKIIKRQLALREATRPRKRYVIVE